MRIRRKKWARPELAVCPFFESEPEKLRARWKERFSREQPLYLELGCGKGVFAAHLALNNSDANLLAVDIKSDMLGVARRRIEEIFNDSRRSVDNLILTAYNVEHLEKILSPEDNVRRIYINFCNPWPKPKHRKRRLTYPNKLEKYFELLPEGGEIRFKTDDRPLFDDTLGYLEQSGFRVTFKTNDLHSEPSAKDNIMTEHEAMFTSRGIKINALTAVRCAERPGKPEETAQD